MRRRVLAACLTFACAVGASGCGGSADEPSDEEQVRAALGQFADAFARRDVQRLCDELLARELVAQVRGAGLPCEVALQQALAEVRRPTLVIERIEVKDDRALARVSTSAQGQRPSQDTIRLQREGETWRIASLARPQPQPPAPIGP